MEGSKKTQAKGRMDEKLQKHAYNENLRHIQSNGSTAAANNLFKSESLTSLSLNRKPSLSHSEIIAVKSSRLSQHCADFGKEAI